MPIVERKSGIRLTLPDSYRVSTSGAKRRRGKEPASSLARPSDEQNAVIAALADQDLELVDTLPILPTAARVRRRARQPDELRAEIELEDNENAVLLIEQDGMYSWNLPQSVRHVTPAQRRRRGATWPGKVATFLITVEPSKARAYEQVRRTRARRGIQSFVVGKITAFVFKFVGGKAIDTSIKFLERKIQTGLIHMNGNDPDSWPRIEHAGSLPLPTNRPPRIMLFVHGTFSSTEGSFGALCQTPWGQEFLDVAREHYDAVIGYDHKTLSIDPLDNAIDLMNQLEGITGGYPPQFDAIAFSRGGLVLRSLLEHLLPGSGWDARFDRCVFVACTNGGTKLAEPENWHALVDIYLNLAVAGARAISVIPQATAVASVFAKGLQGLGALVKFITTHAISERHVPGLAAMEPDGEFITTINQLQSSQPAAGVNDYFAVTSNFEPRLALTRKSAKEMPKKLLMMLADGVVDAVMKKTPNDLVVDTPAMVAIDSQFGDFVTDQFDFGENPNVYHTVYFAQPDVVRVIGRWFELADQALPEADAGILAASIPAAVDTDFVLMDTELAAVEVREELLRKRPKFFVGHREMSGEKLYYPLEADYVIARTAKVNEEISLRHALRLFERNGRGTTVAVVDAGRSAGGQPEPAMRAVLDGETVVGVLADTGTYLSSHALKELAVNIERAERLEEQVRAKLASERQGRVQVFEQQRAQQEPQTQQQQQEDSYRLERERLDFERVIEQQQRERLERERLDVERVFEQQRKRVVAARPLDRLTGLRRRRRPDGGSIVEPSGPYATLAKITCYFRAAMDKEVQKAKKADLEVTISREVLEQAAERASAVASAKLDPREKMLVEVVAKKNFEVVGNDWEEIAPPPMGAPYTRTFSVRGTHVGRGDVRVVVSQGQVPLATLRLTPTIVTGAARRRGQAAARATVEGPTNVPELVPELIVREVHIGPEIRFEYTLDLRQYGFRKRFRSEPLQVGVQEYVEGIYKQIEEYWAASQDDCEDFNQRLREYGGDLFDELFPRELQSALWKNRDRINNILVISEEPFIPWEMVHLKQPGKGLPDKDYFLAQLGLVRWLDLADGRWATLNFKVRADKVVAIVPDYPLEGDRLPGAAEELEFLRETLGARRESANTNALRSLLRKPGAFDLLHFACHGEAAEGPISGASLMMEGRLVDDEYREDLFDERSARQSSNFVGDADGGEVNRPLIVLNACLAGRSARRLTGTGGFARAFLEKGASAVVGALWSVSDDLAREFIRSFYNSLKAGHTFGEATIRARDEAREAGDATWLAYVVYAHPQTRAEFVD